MEMTITMSQIGPSTSKANIRSHEIIVDRPKDKGGDDQGPMGGEILLAAAGGCFNSNLLAAIKSRDVDITNVRLKITGTLEGQPMVYTKILIEISAEGDLGELDKLVTIAEKACISTNTLKSSQVEVDCRVVHSL